MEKKKGIPFFGLVLVLVGAVLLASQFIPNFKITSFWPLIVMTAGAVFLVFGFLGSWGLLVPGVIAGYIGSILLYYNLTGNWDFWQFWLLCPSAVGVGLFLSELFDKKNPVRALSNSWILMTIGAVLFTLFLVPGIWSRLWPALLVLAGVMIILQSLFIRKNRKDDDSGKSDS